VRDFTRSGGLGSLPCWLD